MCKVPLEKLKHLLQPRPTKFPVEYDKVKGEILVVEDMLETFELEQIRNANRGSLTLEENSILAVIQDLTEKLKQQKYLLNRQLIQKEDQMKYSKQIQDTLQNYNLLLNKIRTNGSRSEIYNTFEFRRIIYRCNLAPRTRVAPKFPMDVSGESVKANEKKIRTRLIPYLVREFCALLNRHVIDISPIVDKVIEYLKDGSRQSRNNLVSYLSSLGIGHPSHFINNMMHFIGSGQKLNVYDENCEYAPRGANDIRLYMGGDGGDVQILNETIRRRDNLGRHQRRLAGYPDVIPLSPFGSFNEDIRDRERRSRRLRVESNSPRMSREPSVEDLTEPWNEDSASTSSRVIMVSDEESSDDEIIPPPENVGRSRWNLLDFPSFGGNINFLRNVFPSRTRNIRQEADDFMESTFGNRQSRISSLPNLSIPRIRNELSDLRNTISQATRELNMEGPSSSRQGSSSTTQPITIDDSNNSIVLDDDSDIEVVADRQPPPKRPRYHDL